jgi:hypothetical protein
MAAAMKKNAIEAEEREAVRRESERVAERERVRIQTSRDKTDAMFRDAYKGR